MNSTKTFAKLGLCLLIVLAAALLGCQNKPKLPANGPDLGSAIGRNQAIGSGISSAQSDNKEIKRAIGALQLSNKALHRNNGAMVSDLDRADYKTAKLLGK